MSETLPAGIWNYGDLFDGLGEVVPAGQPALAHGELLITWGELTHRTNNLASALLADGAAPGEKIAIYLRNHPAYVESVIAGFKARQVHVNVNYRYADDEVWYILDNSDATTVVFGRGFAPLVERIRARLPGVRRWLVVDDGTPAAQPASSSAASFATPYESLARTGNGAPLDIVRSPDDLFFIYTGGTTGMPKGVMWRQDPLRRALINPALVVRVPVDLADHLAIVRETGQGPINLPACPLMHGTGLLSAISALVNGGTVVTLPSMQFDAGELWRVVARHRVSQIIIVGDAFAKPMLRALDDLAERRDAQGSPPAGSRLDLSCVLAIISSGTMWSMEVKQGLLRHLTQATLLDAFGSSEAIGFGLSAMTAGGSVLTARFMIGDEVKVFNPQGHEVGRGTGELGIIARAGAIPDGYYKDAAKSAVTFPVIGGVRYSMPGDFCTVDPDGTITLLGRGSGCINTAGEKVYPEEVEEVLKQHPDVEDALVVGLPDDKWGQSVTAVVELRAGAVFDEESLRRHVRGQLAGYKSPKRLVAVPAMFRAPNGKADYKRAREFAQSVLAG